MADVASAQGTTSSISWLNNGKKLFVTYTGASAGSGTWVLGSDGNLYGVWQYAGFSDAGTEVWLRSMPPEKGDAGPTPIPEPPGTAGGRLITKGGEVVLEILPSEAGFTNELWLFAPDNRFLGVTNRDLGAEVPLGSFAIGEELVFGIKVQNTGNEYATGPAERNPDGVVHAVTKVLGPDRVLVAFEDLEGGGDRDFNDLVFVLKGEIGGVDSDPLVLTSICTRG